MSTAGGRLPFPGLRSFTREETDLFFGREGCVDDMVDRLAATRFLAVLGASGSGKSSLVRTGLLDALEIGLLHQAGSNWLIADFRPGEHPIQNMAEGLLRAVAADPYLPPDEEEAKFLRTFLARGPRSVVEWCEENLPAGANLLLLVDQFEELFRYGAYSEREEAEAFVAALLESARAPLEQARIYVAITMRSEYLGAAALIDGLAEAINKGLYLTPRMNREEVREAIVGPAAVCGFAIEPALVNRLLNDLSSFAPWDEGDTGHQLERLVRRADQLPLMQHVLNRLWSIAAERATNGQVVLKLSDYDALGGLKGALAAHGREILDELLPEHRALAPAVFRALTSGSSLAEAVRRPTEFGELVEVAGGDEIAVREIVEAFRAPGRNFLMPPRPAALRPTTLIDISHESLIRQWDEFAGWLQTEVTAADTWRRLVDAAERYRRGEANLLSDLALASNASWWDREQPTAAWAKRHGGDFEQTAKFLADSRRADAEGKDAEARDRRQKSRNRLVTAAVIVILCIITPLTGFAGYSAWRANQEAAAADEARANAERDRVAAVKAREQAEAAQRSADAQRFEAETARATAEEQRQQAEAARLTAEEQRRQADAARLSAEEQRLAAEAATKEARESAERERQAQEQILALERQRAEEERQRVEQERLRAEEAHAEFQRTNLAQLAERVTNLQRAGSWDAASNLLGAYWQGLVEPNPDEAATWLGEPIAAAFTRQKFGEYPVTPEFLAYGGLEGWTGTSGRFRVYDLEKKASDGSTASGNKIITLLDGLTGAAVGAFDLPPGDDLGSELDLVAPDGTRLAIVTAEPSADDGHDDRKIALWANTRAAPMMIPMPDLGGDVDLDQMAPVSTGPDFALFFLKDSTPAEVSFFDAAAGEITFSATVEDITGAMEYEKIDAVSLIGLDAGKVYMLVNSSSDGRILLLDKTEETVREVAVGGGITGAQLSPDGTILLTLTCPGDCTAQSLTAYDLATEEPLWVERVPTGMAFTDTAVQDIVVDGKPAYSALVQDHGIGIVFQIPKDRAAAVARVSADAVARMGTYAFDADGGYKTVEAATDIPSSDGVEAAGLLARYRVPLSRQKLRLYVAPNSIAVYQDKDAVRIAGVTYDGELLVYRMRPDGSFEEDVSFRPLPLAESNCISAVAFGADGHSLLFRHFDGSLFYVAAVGYGANVGWRQALSSRQGESRVELSASTPATTCDAPDATAADFMPERIVPADTTPGSFALLDNKGVVWWVSVAEGGDDATAREGQRSAGTTATAGGTREFRALERAGDGRVWIAGDPERRRVAMVSRTSVEIVRHVAESADAGYDQAAKVDATRRQKLLGRSDPKAATFTPLGDIVVAYGDGSLSGYREAGENWEKQFETGFFLSAPITGIFATPDRIAIADDRDVIDALDPASGALTGVARAPANPSVVALSADGKVLSVEWDTDSVATLDFAVPVAPEQLGETARLVSMRSAREQEPDTSLDALMIDQRMGSLTGENRKTGAPGCAEAAEAHLAALEARLLGETGGDLAMVPPGCTEMAADSALAAAGTLAQRGLSANIRELVEDGAFTRVLQAAVAGDSAATRMLGAVLARIAIERGDLDAAAVAADALRFGSSLPTSLLKDIAAGRVIPRELAEAARAHAGADPAVEQLLGHAGERRINDIDALTDALFDFSLAERLYRDADRIADAEYVGNCRAQLARLLPDENVLAVIARLDAWKPVEASAPAAAALPDPSSDPTARRDLDMENADKLAAMLPGSPLLETLRTELERARIFDLRASDPKAAAEMLMALGVRQSGAGGGSTDLGGEYLELAEEIGAKSDPASVFRLSVETVKLIAGNLKGPIDTDADASDLFRRAAEMIAATAPIAPRDIVMPAMESVDLSFLDYEYDTLPAIGAEAAVRASEAVLEAAVGMARALGAVADDPAKWQWLAAKSVFWQGVLVNDDKSRTAQAVTMLRTAADEMKPLVDAAPEDPQARFRYAEALRWVGLAEASTPETAAIEQESVKQYKAIWDDRWMLDADLLNKVGTGYGFGLANLAQTTREVELANLEDGRSAEDHAAWVLEILALASEKDAVNAGLIDAGAITADAGFQGGWYRMSSYGWPIGFLAGLVGLERGGETVTKCDLLAADPYDPLRRAPGTTLDLIDTATAEAECKAEHERNPDDARATYQLARMMSADMTREAEFMPLAREAAAAGVSPAFSLVAYALNNKDDARAGDAYIATTQRTVIEAFPVLFPFLAEHAKTDREKAALAWLAGKAAELGMPEAHLALIDGDDPVENLFHAKLAARLFGEAGKTRAASEAERKAGAIRVSSADAATVEANVAAWQPRPLVELPADADSS